MQSCYFSPALLSAPESWRLLRWCAEHGGTELAIRVRCVASEPAPVADDFEDTFAASSLGTAPRRVLGADPEEKVQPVRLWRLTGDSIESLRRFLPGGLFSHVVDPAGWLEDPTVYRDGELLLGVVTHEQEGVLRVTAPELRELETLGFDFAPRGSAITY
jgi:hypothetical protein